MDAPPSRYSRSDTQAADGSRASGPGPGPAIQGERGRSRRRFSELRLRKLIEATDVMLGRIEELRVAPRAVLEEACSTLVPEFADAIRIDLMGGNGGRGAPILVFDQRQWRGVAWNHLADPAWEAIRPVLTNGTSHLMRSSDQLSFLTDDADDGECLIAGPQAGALVMVPLLVRGRCAGALTLASQEASRRYTTADLAFAEALARRIAVLLENAELLDLTEAGTRWRQEILGIVAHELRNSLSTIAITAESLRLGWLEGEGAGAGRKAGGWDPKSTGQRQLGLIVGAVQRMKKFVSDLLDSVQLESGRLAVTPEPVPLKALLEMVVDANEAKAAERRVTLELQETADVIVEADEHRIAQVIANFMDNALKFTPPGGTVSLSAVVKHREVKVAVRDTGRGMSPEEVESLFSTEWRPRRSRDGGYGLGLVIARLIVTAHGGRIGAESEVGRGSTFYFTLPLANRSPRRT